MALVPFYKDKPFKGLANIGSTCYINTAMSCLGSCLGFLHFVLTKIDPDRKDLAGELRSLWNDQWNNGNSLIPRRFVKHLKESFTELEIHTQNDINEFLALFVDKLNRCISQEISVSKEDLLEMHRYDNTPYDTQRLKMDLSWYSKNAKEYSALLDMFYGQNISQIICGGCGHIHHNYEMYFNIMAPISDASQTLYDCLDSYFHDEKLNTNCSEWKCDNCNRFSQSDKTHKLWRNPSVLVVSLKRFCHNGNRFNKKNTKVSIPRVLDIQKYSLSKTNNTYTLSSVAMHVGNIQGGHYYSVCLHPNGNWYTIDDLEVKQTKDPDFSTNGYVFFYHSS